MRNLILYILFGCLFSVTTHAQSFRYDTIRVSNNTNNNRSTQTQQQPRAETKTQGTSSPFKKENLIFGGTFGLQLGNHITTLNISPQIGYRFNQYLSAGFGVGYTYYKADSYYGMKDVTQNYLGGNIYGQLNPIQYLRLQVQPEIYRFWGSYSPDTKVVGCLLVGAGAFVPTGNRTGINFMLYYDVLQGDYSPYGNEIFYSVGFSIGF